MNSLRCAGCRSQLKGTSLLNCSRCPDQYHYTCMNISKKQYTEFSKDFKDTWVCPTCRCKEPKSGDNSNTPVRGATSSTSPSAPKQSGARIDNEYDNVTLRAKPRSISSCHCLSADLIREIIREELDRKFNSQIKDIQTKLTSIDESLLFYSAELDRVNRESETQKQIIVRLQKANEGLQVTSRDLSHRVHQLELLSRTNNVEIQCVPEHKNENIYNTVLRLGNSIKCPLTEVDVQYCSRIAKLNSGSPRPRSILVKFSSRRLRDTFLAGVIKFNRNNPTDKLNTGHLGIGGSKKSPVFVSEHLTSELKSLHAAARLRAKQLNYKFVWVRDGKVFVRKTENCNFIHIKSADVLASLS